MTPRSSSRPVGTSLTRRTRSCAFPRNRVAKHSVAQYWCFALYHHIGVCHTVLARVSQPRSQVHVLVLVFLVLVLHLKLPADSDVCSASALGLHAAVGERYRVC